MPPQQRDRDPITDTTTLTDTSRITDTTTVTSQQQTSSQVRPAGPPISMLFLYDAGDDDISAAAPALQEAYYRGAKRVGVRTWRELTAELSRYSSIDTLVLDLHSAEGQLLLGDENPTTEEAQERFARSGVQVTGAIRFEGCNIMRDPIATALMVAKIAEPNTVASGYTYYSIMHSKEIVPGDLAGVEAVLQSYEGYWLPNVPKAAEIAKSPRPLWMRWFRKDDIDDPPSPRTAESIGPRRSDFSTYNQLESRTVPTREEAERLRQEFSQPIYVGALVTITNIAAVAHTPEQKPSRTTQ